MITIITPTIRSGHGSWHRPWLSTGTDGPTGRSPDPVEDRQGSSSSTAHRGPAKALLKAVETEWLVCLDDDDLLQPTYIAEVTQRLETPTWCTPG